MGTIVNSVHSCSKSELSIYVILYKYEKLRCD